MCIEQVIDDLENRAETLIGLCHRHEHSTTSQPIRSGSFCSPFGQIVRPFVAARSTVMTKALRPFCSL